MSRALRRRLSVRVFDASSSPLRMEILRALSLHGPLSYSEIMEKVGLDLSKHAGRFAYHLRSVQRANLIELTKDSRRYRLTDLGVKLVDFQQELEEYALKKMGKLLVRTSRLAIEDFDRGRIVASLIKEAQVPADLADKIAREVEERLLGLQVRYLTAPLIREIVNAVLIEKGLEEYRHRLTRLGLPVYDVTQTIAEASRLGFDGEALTRMAGDAVLKEYVLLNVLPRNVADAHLSGLIHIGGGGAWILKPDYFQHDPRFFFKEGLATRAFVAPYALSTPPRSLQAALNCVLKAVEAMEREVTKEQGMDAFNVLLAPYVRGLGDEELKDALQAFLVGLVKPREVEERPTLSLGLELEVPKDLRDLKAVGPSKEQGVYGNYADEALRIASALIELLGEASRFNPALSPHVIFKVRPNAFRRSRDLLLLAHELAARNGIPFFAYSKDASSSQSYWADGLHLTSEGQGFEAETLRASLIGDVTVNLPRIAFEARGEDSAFNRGLEEAVGLASEALEVRSRALYDRTKENLLPFLFQGNGEPYCRLELTRLAVSALGLYESTYAHTGKSLLEDRDARGFAEKAVRRLAALVEERGASTGERLKLTGVCGSDASERLVKIDEERFGQVVARNQGNRSGAYYTNLGTVPMEAQVSIEERLEVEGLFGRYYSGGQITVLQLNEEEVDEEELLRLSEAACVKYGLSLFAYSRRLTCCQSCRETFLGFSLQCPKCGSTKAVVTYARQDAKYLPLRYWKKVRQINLDKTALYGVGSAGPKTG